MVQSNASTVDEYMADVDPNRRSTLERLRELCRQRLVGWEEKMAWGMPGYGPANADPVVSFNSQKQHISLYVGAGPIDRFEDQLAGIDRGKACLRFHRLEQLDFEVLSALLGDVHRHGRG